MLSQVNEVGVYDIINDFFYDLSDFLFENEGKLNFIKLYLNDNKTAIIGIELIYGNTSTGIFHNNNININIDNKIDIDLKDLVSIKGSYYCNQILKLLFVNKSNQEFGFNVEDKCDTNNIKHFIMNIKNDEYLSSLKFAFGNSLVYFAKICKPIISEDTITQLQNSSLYSSKFFGKQFNDTHMQIIDYTDLKDAKISNIILYHDGGLVYGSSITYVINNNDKKVIDFGKKTKMFEVLNMADGEYINKIILRTGDLIDGVSLFTNLDNGIVAGGNGGGVHIFDIDKLKKDNIINSFIGFDGGYTGLLHKIRVIFK